MPGGIPYIISNEAAERFSFYGMKAILVIFMTEILWLMNSTPGTPMSRAEANEMSHLFIVAVYFTPLVGAFISDAFLGKYRTIIYLSIVYCLGHGALALMGIQGDAKWWMLAGLGLIAVGAGGIKPCVSAHVGDQFGEKNSHLLTKVFNLFYFSINLGAFVSTLLTPLILAHYGPHWAFGIPGALMALATLFFWMGRHKFIHVPADKTSFMQELRSPEGVAALKRLIPLFAFVAIFWSLFDQHATSWVFQAQDMDRQFLGIDWYESQIAAINPILILTFVPLFTLVIYPAVQKRLNFTPLRKIGTGLFMTIFSFVLVAIIQEWIDAGQRPNIGWQLIAFAILTAAEVMVSVVCLEFAYTQSPRKMKSMIMAFYLLSVAAGNLVTASVNHFIQIENPVTEEKSLVVENDTKTHPGFDQKIGTEDDIQIIDNKTTSSAAAVLDEATALLTKLTEDSKETLPVTEIGQTTIGHLNDPWGNPLRYRLLNSATARISSDGPDKSEKTKWDLGYKLTIPGKAEKSHRPWVENRKKELGLLEDVAEEKTEEFALSKESFAGGQIKLEGAGYFWLFAGIMLVTAILFVPYALSYKGQTYLQE
nr:peptide transporter family 1-like [Nerophis lumbriciformis]